MSDVEVPKRKRGRPSGKNRVPLKAEERRARNALYERERREEFSKALRELAEVYGCDENTSTCKLLKMAQDTIEKYMPKANGNPPKKKRRSIEKLLAQNFALSEKIKVLEEAVDEFSLEDWVDLPEEVFG